MAGLQKRRVEAACCDSNSCDRGDYIFHNQVLARSRASASSWTRIYCHAGYKSSHRSMLCSGVCLSCDAHKESGFYLNGIVGIVRYRMSVLAQPSVITILLYSGTSMIDTDMIWLDELVWWLASNKWKRKDTCHSHVIQTHAGFILWNSAILLSRKKLRRTGLCVVTFPLAVTPTRDTFTTSCFLVYWTSRTTTTGHHHPIAIYIPNHLEIPRWVSKSVRISSKMILYVNHKTNAIIVSSSSNCTANSSEACRQLSEAKFLCTFGIIKVASLSTRGLSYLRWGLLCPSFFQS